MTDKRYDVRYEGNSSFLVDSVNIDLHYCREWDENGGCYGTNPDHGYSFEDAKQKVINYLEWKVKYISKLTESDLYDDDEA